MSRQDEFKSKTINPCKKFLTWGSNNKCFSYYNKETAEKELVTLPLKFILLKQLHTVKGWNNESQSGIYSNEIPLYKLGVEELIVKSFKGGEIATGIYSNIKIDVEKGGGHYSRSIYAINDKEELININLKGSASAVWSSFFKENSAQLLENFIEVTGAKDERNGSISYTTPILKVGEKIGGKDAGVADEKYQLLISYLETYLVKDIPKPDLEDGHLTDITKTSLIDD